MGALDGKFRRDEGAHNRMVAHVARWLNQNSYPDLRADVEGYSQPGKITWTKTGEGHIPDLTAGDFVIEVETDDTISIDHTRSQCELFAAYAKQHGKRFVVVVPNGYKATMQSWLVAWGLAAEVWEV